jgi:hypothetical protein
MIRAVQNIDDNKTLYFDAKTAYEAMSKLIYYLNTIDGRNAKNLTINKTESNRFLYVIYNGKTYSTKME